MTIWNNTRYGIARMMWPLQYTEHAKTLGISEKLRFALTARRIDMDLAKIPQSARWNADFTLKDDEIYDPDLSNSSQTLHSHFDHIFMNSAALRCSKTNYDDLRCLAWLGKVSRCRVYVQSGARWHYLGAIVSHRCHCCSGCHSRVHL